MQHPIKTEPSYTHDVIIIGGGINGTGVARDCALRGLKVILFEKNDLAHGASGNNSGMIHGGARYLTSHPSVTEDACRDSGYIQKIAPHLIFRIPFLVPVLGEGIKGKVSFIAYDAFFDFYDKYQPLKGGEPHTVLTPDEVHELEPGLQGQMAGAVTFDEWGVDALRLCASNIVDAEKHGAQTFVHWEVFDFLKAEENGKTNVFGIQARDRLSGKKMQATAPIVINATGAWGGITAGLIPKAVVKTRPGKGIHVLFDRRISNYAVVAKAIDGRQVFVMPWQNISWIGTTDDDFYGDLDSLTATTDEVRYLIEAVAKVLPEVRQARVIGTTVGARPSLYEWGQYEDEVSREHEIVDHEKAHHVCGLYSMIGGKLASYRVFAEEMSNIIAEKLHVQKKCQTHVLPLPGGEKVEDSKQLSEELKLPEPLLKRIVYRHGTIAKEIIQAGKETPKGLDVVCACESVTDAEIRYTCKKEHVRTLGDLSRRTRLGLGGCSGMGCAHRASAILEEENKHLTEETLPQTNLFLQNLFERRAPALDGEQIKQEELLRSQQIFSYGILQSKP